MTNPYLTFLFSHLIRNVSPSCRIARDPRFQKQRVKASRQTIPPSPFDPALENSKGTQEGNVDASGTFKNVSFHGAAQQCRSFPIDGTGKDAPPPARGGLINNGETESVRSSFRDVASKRTHSLIKDTIPADIGK